MLPGTTAVFTNFIQQPLPPGSSTGADGEQSGALGRGQQASTSVTTFNQFWQYAMPMIGAYIVSTNRSGLVSMTVCSLVT